MKNTEFVNNALKYKGYGYVYGAKGQMYSKAEAERMAESGSKSEYYYLTTCKRWFGHNVVDCSGLVYLALGKKNMRRADGYMESCNVQGSIKTIPEKVGLIVWKSGHIGIYIGGGKVVESRGVAYGVVITNVKDRPWTKWGELPDIDYASQPAPKPQPAPTYMFTLKRELYYVTKKLSRKATNMHGDDVRAVQLRLITLGFSCGSSGADGSFGKKTDEAVVAFQKKNKDKSGKPLTPDGVVGKKTCEALKGKWEGK